MGKKKSAHFKAALAYLKKYPERNSNLWSRPEVDGTYTVWHRWRDSLLKETNDDTVGSGLTKKEAKELGARVQN